MSKKQENAHQVVNGKVKKQEDMSKLVNGKVKKQEDVSKLVNGKVKKHGKFKGKHIKPVTKQQGNKGPPLKVEDFSSNWKKFLSNQQKNVQAVQKKSEQNSKNIQRTETKMKNKEKSLQDGHKNGGEAKPKKSQNKKRKRSDSLQNGTDREVKSNDIWFDVDPQLLHKTNCTKGKKSVADPDNIPNPDVIEKSEDQKENKCSNANLTRHIAIDCEMVGVGIEGKESVLARVSIVNSHCECVYDKYVSAKEKVVDFRTHVSGIRPSDLKNGCEYNTVQKEVSDLLNDRILVGHALQNDLKVLMLSHPKKNIRDTSKYKPFRQLLKTKRPALKRLAEEILHKEIQVGEHNSVIDARITMQLYKRYKKEWERSLHVKEPPPSVAVKEIYMGGSNENEKRKTKVNKWKKIRDRKKKKREE